MTTSAPSYDDFHSKPGEIFRIRLPARIEICSPLPSLPSSWFGLDRGLDGDTLALSRHGESADIPMAMKVQGNLI
jgi:hypothetical protein